MKLNNSYLKSFKVIREFSIDIKGISISILGKNKTDKTTVFDVFYRYDLITTAAILVTSRLRH